MLSEYEVQGISVSQLAARYGTPLFVYDGAVISSQFLALRKSLHLALEVFFSLKAVFARFCVRSVPGPRSAR
ncbi:MAG TPA: hypothetical protein VIY52_16930 [Streptosporangiaceae bacterium]